MHAYAEPKNANAEVLRYHIMCYKSKQMPSIYIGIDCELGLKHVRLNSLSDVTNTSEHSSIRRKNKESSNASQQCKIK